MSIIEFFSKDLWIILKKRCFYLFFNILIYLKIFVIFKFGKNEQKMNETKEKTLKNKKKKLKI